MAKRPQQHVIADQGVAEIVRLLSKAGWACDRVQSDYGEDLICQTSFRETIDPHRILIQVKSTRKRFTRSLPKLRIKRETLLKWLSDSNLVVICVWSTSEKSALFEIPSNQFQLYDVDLSNETYYNLEFSLNNSLTEQAAGSLAWIARLRSIKLHFLERQDLLDGLSEHDYSSKKEYLNAKEQLEKNHFSVGLKFLFYIGLLESQGQYFTIDTGSCLYELLNLGAAAKDKRALQSLRMSYEEILLFMIVARASRNVSGVGFPQVLLGNSMRVLNAYILQRFRGDAAIRALSESKVKKIFCSMARRMWLFGATLSDDELEKAANSMSFVSIPK